MIGENCPCCHPPPVPSLQFVCMGSHSCSLWAPEPASISQVVQLALSVIDRKLAWTPEPDGGHGEVFTRRWVVELILDTVGYQVDADLGNTTIVEPSCGLGAFILPIVERLVDSCLGHGYALDDMGGAIRGFDLLEHNTEHTRKAVMEKLFESGASVETAERLSGEWVTTGDFLLADHHEGEAGFVVGNPPYIRLEDMPSRVSDAYRAECSTMRGRADIFVGFFEKGLSLLAPGGKLAFIWCGPLDAQSVRRTTSGTRRRELLSRLGGRDA